MELIRGNTCRKITICVRTILPSSRRLERTVSARHCIRIAIILFCCTMYRSKITHTHTHAKSHFVRVSRTSPKFSTCASLIMCSKPGGGGEGGDEKCLKSEQRTQPKIMRYVRRTYVPLALSVDKSHLEIEYNELTFTNRKIGVFAFGGGDVHSST